jgi:hypothetical protein
MHDHLAVQKATRLSIVRDEDAGVDDGDRSLAEEPFAAMADLRDWKGKPGGDFQQERDAPMLSRSPGGSSNYLRKRKQSDHLDELGARQWPR